MDESLLRKGRCSPLWLEDPLLEAFDLLVLGGLLIFGASFSKRVRAGSEALFLSELDLGRGEVVPAGRPRR